MKKIEKAGIIGLGALGSMYAKMLTDAMGRENCYVIADRSRVERYKKDGVYYNGELYDYNYVSPGEIDGPLDLVIFACKFGGLSDCIETVRPLVGPGTTLISVLNGVSSEKVVSDAYSANQVVWCYARWMAAKKLGNQVTIEDPGQLVFGMPSGMDRAHYNRLVDFLSCFYFPFSVSEDILTEMWGKLLCNDGLNQATMVFDCDYSGVQKEGEARTAMIGAMREVQAVAKAEGIELSEEIFQKWLGVIDNFESAGETSMRQDRMMKRRSEVELFAGTIRRLAAKHSIPVPFNDMFYERVKEIEAQY